MKNLFKKFSLFSFFLSLLLSLTCCAPIKMVKVNGLSDFHIERDKAEKQVEVSISLNIYNPNKYKIVLSGYNVSFLLNDKVITQAVNTKRQVLKGNQDGQLTFLMETDWGTLGKVVKGTIGGLLQGKIDVEAHLTGKIKGRVFIFSKTVKVDESKKFKYEF